VSRRYRKGWQKKISDYLWLVVPAGIISLVLVLALFNRQREPRVTIKTPQDAPGVSATPTTSASPSASPGMEGSPETDGLLEEFVITTPGEELPDPVEDVALPGDKFPDLGQEHIPEGEPVEYNSNPPTSGSHYAVWAKWGIYETAPLDQRLVHNLEHGGIVISYDPELIQGNDLEQLRIQVRDLSQINPRIILTPREKFGAAIALTAWTYLQKLDTYDPEVVKAFYDAHIARGPECQKGQCPG
jgi:Protein of unknown function (DUF3105)